MPNENRLLSTNAKTADLYRMVMDGHVCPYGLKAKDLLERRGFQVNDHPLQSKAETDAFKRDNDVSTTPQVFIAGERIGGYEALQEHLGEEPADQDSESYQPVIAIFSVAFLMALVLSWSTTGMMLPIQIGEWFVALSMCILGIQKLQDIESFSTMFLNYDLLARRVVRYGYFYPFAETTAGILMLGGVLNWLSIPLALFIGSVGAVSVFKAVYIDKRELKCACVGGSSKVPLGFISLTENLMMMAMGLWMWLK